MPYAPTTQNSAERSSRRTSSAAGRSRSSRPRTLAGVGVAVVVVALGAGTVATTTGTASAAAATSSGVTTSPSPINFLDTGDSVAAEALASARLLADGHSGTTPIPASLVHELGYTPVVENSHWSRADGDCSSPVPLPASFEPGCRIHDLGYDLLRVAHRHGAPIPAGLRAALDSLLRRHMRDSCEGSVPCTVMADIAHVAVSLNTIRQGHGAPVEESFPW